MPLFRHKQTRLLTKEEIKTHAFNFLDEQHTAVIATAPKNGKPQAATVYYKIDADFTFHFVTSKNSHKHLNLKENPWAGIVVGFGPATVTIEGAGPAEIQEDDIPGDVLGEILNRINFNSPNDWPITKIAKEGFVYIRVKPEWLSMLNLDKEGWPATYSEDFHTIIP